MDLKLVPSTIVENLDRDGAATFKDLYNKTHKLHSDLNEQTFNQTLMEMEIQGLIRVYRLPKGKKRIELV
jgi:DNA-binding HxlR family transcriptional regulator